MPRRLLALALVTALIACSSDRITPPSPMSIAGIWTLRSLSGYPVPYTIYPEGGFPTTYISERIVFTGAGTFSELDSTALGNDTTEAPRSGDFRITGDSIYVQTSDGFDGGTISGDTITIKRFQLFFAFVRVPAE
jgi:hypothetical protein